MAEPVRALLARLQGVKTPTVEAFPTRQTPAGGQGRVVYFSSPPHSQRQQLGRDFLLFHPSLHLTVEGGVMCPAANQAWSATGLGSDTIGSWP